MLKLSKNVVLAWMDRIGKLIIFALVLVQAVLLAQYPSIYWKNRMFNWMILLMLPTLAALAWYYNPKKHKEQIKWLWVVWLIYTCTLLIPMVGVIFGGLRSKLDKNHSFGPNVLKMTMCCTPAIALLLFITTSGARRNSDLIEQLCGNVAVDLFDYIEALVILLPQSRSVNLPVWIAGCTVACVCASLVLSTLEIAENKLTKEGTFKIRQRLYFWRLVLQVLLVNFALLVIRFVVWLKYEHDASIFIAKNIILIVIAISNIVWKYLDNEEKNEMANDEIKKSEMTRMEMAKK